jgi:hypothetical protein
MTPEFRRALYTWQVRCWRWFLLSARVRQKYCCFWCISLWLCVLCVQYNPGVDDEEADCIPFQLQKLFGMLQMSTKRSVSTKELTNSFGWNSGEAFQQNDVQEVGAVAHRLRAGADGVWVVFPCTSAANGAGHWHVVVPMFCAFPAPAPPYQSSLSDVSRLVRRD